ncbi:unnamed protein product, partial [Clonostachys solani]
MPSPLKIHIFWLILLFLSNAIASTSDDALPGLVAYPDCAKPCIISAIQVVMNISRIDCDETARDRSIELKVATITVGTVAGLFVMLRFGYKLMISNAILAMDDWLTLAIMIVVIPNLIITTNGTIPNGLGRDIWTLTPDQITTAIRFFFITAVLYFALTTLVKLLFLSFYLKVFPTRVVQQVLWGTFAVTALWGVGFVFLTIFQCQPISYFWQKWDGLHDGTCLDANTIAWANASSGIALDVWILAIPLLQLRKLQLKWKKKIGVVLMFLVGAFVTIISILRLKSLVNFAMSSNATWDYFDVTMWSIIEISVGVMCACLPTVRLLLVRMFPALGDSNSRSLVQADYQYTSGIRSRHRKTAEIVAQDAGAPKLDCSRSTKE